MKRFSFEFGTDFESRQDQNQLWAVPARQVWEMLSLRERESLKKNAPPFGRACAFC
jgi:hypothetical protein